MSDDARGAAVLLIAGFWLIFGIYSAFKYSPVIGFMLLSLWVILWLTRD